MASGDVKFELETDGLGIEYEGPEGFARDHLVGIVFELVNAVQQLQATESTEEELEVEIVEAEPAVDSADVITLKAEDDGR